MDEDNLLYEYGEFRYVNNFENCASVCVQLVQPNLLNGGSFQGIDYDCTDRTCRCLYSSGALNNRNSGNFYRTSTIQRGEGAITSTLKRSGFYCGKLAGASEEEAATEVSTAVEVSTVGIEAVVE